MARKVLVADDSVTIQKVVGLTFANEDIELSFVDNGEEAISIARKLKPDLIMADVLMPGRSGYEVCEAIKTDPELRHTPVLLLTGTFEPFDADRCAQVRADGTITKPFESQTLIRQVHELLDRPRQRAAAAPPAGEDASAAPRAAAAAPEVPADPAGVPDSAAAEPVAPSPVDATPDPETDFGNLTLDEEEFQIGEEPAEAPPAPADVPESPADEIDFARDPDAALNRESIDAPQTADEGAEESWTAALENAPDTPPESALPQDEDVWDLSDFEAVDERRDEGEAAQASPDEPDSLWNEAAAEAIDIVESTNLDVEGESGAPSAGTPGAAEEDPFDQMAAELPSPSAIDADDRFAEIAGETEYDEFELSPSGAPSRTEEHGAEPERVEEPLSAPEPAPAPEADAPAGREVPTGGEILEELTLEEIAEDEAALPPADEASTPQPAATAAPPEAGAPLAGLGTDRSAEIVRDAVKDAVEKITWEAFSDLSETVVRAVQEKVEKIAWEVIPQLAETIIKEEIRKMKEGTE